MGRTGQFTFCNVFSGCISQLSDYPDVRLTRDAGINCWAAWMRNRHGCKSQTSISRRWDKGIASDKAARTAESGQPRIFAADERSGTDQSAYAGVWFFNVISRPSCAEHLAKITGIHFSSDQLIRLLHRHGFSVHRPKHTLKGKRNEAAYEKARESLVRLKKKR